ncbi:MAG: hypothetical protein HRT89_07140, partial [Lentisphaeria bacterium]|nr:hypothetical protein [Lentisphaeria bacterium]NQZ67828.1 hypothetical protein [Lentisphaeria bacterium]
MAYFIRKTIKLGPITFNLSKDGPDPKTIVTRFQIVMDALGRTYVHPAKTGSFVKEFVKKPRVNSENDIPRSLKNLLNESYKSFRMDYMIGVTFIIQVIFALFFGLWLGSIVMLFLLIFLFLLGSFLTVQQVQTEKGKRTLYLDYELDSGEVVSFNKIIDAMNSLESNTKLLFISSSQSASQENAGVDLLIQSMPVQIGEGYPPWVESNVHIPMILIDKHRAVYFLPDGLVYYDKSSATFLNYADFETSFAVTGMAETEIPSDSKVTGKTWKYVNADGTRDSKHSKNPQISVCQYGKISMVTKDDFSLTFYTSKHN